MLSDVSFEAKPGQMIALLGATGSGKTTLVNLIPRFYDVTAGLVTIDGTDIRDVTLASLRGNIGLVQQDVFLFSATISDNIAYGVADASRDEIVEAAKAAHLHDFIESLPDGYDTWVGERGLNLSGGQKKLLELGRTMMTDAKIVFLDEVGAGVNRTLLNTVGDAIQRLNKERGYTFCIIEHDMDLIASLCDPVIVLAEGSVLTQGPMDMVRNDPRVLEAYLGGGEEAA